jgi:large subunit ribosomal protein L13
MIIDATDLIMGRLASFVAKKALLVEKIDIVNCEKAIITGTRANILFEYKKRFDLGRNPYKGPFFPRASDRIVRRAIRGMLPYKQEKGKNAFKAVMCYVGIPEKLKGQKLETVERAGASKLKNYKYIKVGELSKHLGSKI